VAFVLTFPSATVIGTTSTQEKAELAKQNGAAHVILYTETDFAEEVNKLTNGKGVDAIYDGVGKTTFIKGFDCLKKRGEHKHMSARLCNSLFAGTMVSFGNASGPAPEIAPLFLIRGSWSLTRPSLMHFISEQEEFNQRKEELLHWLSDGALRLSVGASFPLSKAAEAHRFLESRASTGSLVLIPDHE
jgi:NADPH2:quinone reductase